MGTRKRIFWKNSLTAVGIGIVFGALALVNISKAGEETMKIAVMEETKEGYREALEAFEEANPDISLEVVGVSEDEKSENSVAGIQEKLEKGEGPDVFLLNAANPLISDVVKSSRDGLFSDMEEVLGERLLSLPLNTKAMEAGVVDGKRCFVPLGISINGVLTTEEWLGDFYPSAKDAVGFLTELLEHEEDMELPPKDTWEESLANLFSVPVMDEKSGELKPGEKQQEFLEFFEKHSGSKEEFLKDRVKLTILGEANAYMAENFAGRWLSAGKTPVFLAVPDNGERNAAIARYAAVRKGSPYQEEAAKLIEFLLEDTWQVKLMELQGNPIAQYPLPVNQEAVEENLLQKLTFCSGELSEEEAEKRIEKAAKQMAEEAGKVTTVRFCAQENERLKERFSESLK